MSGRLVLIVKATRHCNLRCAYCHDWRVGASQRMDFKVMATMIRAALRDSEYDSIDFIWHGGEPTVLPISFYEKALYVQSRFRRPEQFVMNSVQTNGTRITPQWARFWALNGFTVSISLDGPPEVHDKTRVYASGRASFEDVLKGMGILRNYRVPFGVLMVIDHEALEIGPDRIFDFFLEHGITTFGLIPVAPTNQPSAVGPSPTEHYVDPAQMTAFLMRMYDRWEEHGDPRICIRELRSLRSRLLGRPPQICTLAGGCLAQYYAVEPNGDVAHCDRFVGDPRYTVGNVAQQSFSDFASTPAMLGLLADEEAALTKMRGCPNFDVCNGWCPHDRYLSKRHHLGHRDDCCGLRDLIEHIRSRLGERSPATPAAVATS
jgi:serine-type anaerobic sulfatase-maturating enzyme